jgi:hypothetical protein
VTAGAAQCRRRPPRAHELNMQRNNRSRCADRERIAGAGRGQEILVKARRAGAPIR